VDSHLSDCSSSSRTPASQRRRQSWGETTTHVTVMKTIRSAGFLHPLLIFLLNLPRPLVHNLGQWLPPPHSHHPPSRHRNAGLLLAPTAGLAHRRTSPDRQTSGVGAPSRLHRWPNDHHRQAAATPDLPSTCIAAGRGATPTLSNLCVSAGTRVAPNICAKTAAGTETRERDRRKTGGSSCAERRSINRVALLPPPTKQRFGLIRWRGVGPDEDKLGRPAQRGQGQRTRPSTPLVVHLSFSTCQVSLSLPRHPPPPTQRALSRGIHEHALSSEAAGIRLR